MRLSKYTTILPLTEEFSVIFSAMTDTFIIANYKSFKRDAGRIVAKTELLKNQLQQAKAIVDREGDEVSELKRIIEYTDNNPKEYHLHINPTLNCNFKCWYCYEEHQIGSKMGNDTCEAVKAHIRKIINERTELKTFTLSFFGGEPLMYFNQIAGPLLKYASVLCREHGINLHTHFTTNAYLLTEGILRELNGMSVSFQITLDGGREAHNKVRFSGGGRGSYDTIMHNSEKLALEGHNVLLRINYTTDNIDSISQIISDLGQFSPTALNRIKVDFQRVWQDRPILTEEEIIAKINGYREQLDEMSVKYSTSIVGFSHVSRSCYGDKTNHVLVNYDGNLFLCTARDFKPDKAAGKIMPDGSLKWIEQRRKSFLESKFCRSICHACRIAPLCGGGCRQRAIEQSDQSKCLYNYSDADIDSLIMNRFKARYNLADSQQ